MNLLADFATYNAYFILLWLIFWAGKMIIKIPRKFF